MNIVKECYDKNFFVFDNFLLVKIFNSVEFFYTLINCLK